MPLPTNDKNCIYKKTSEFIIKTRNFADSEFSSDEWFFCIFYGSYAFKTANDKSDLDILFVCDNVDEKRISRVCQFTKELHLQYGMPLDFDIPYEKKAVIQKKFFENACSAKGVYIDGVWQLPKIIKDPAYLSSERLLLRFFLGMMTNPHVFVMGDYKYYLKARRNSFLNILKAIVNINALTDSNINELVKKFCEFKGATGELFIGFRYEEPYISYLLEYIQATFATLLKPLKKDSHGCVYSFEEYIGTSPEIFQ